MTTNATFISAVQSMTVSGVIRHYDQPPAALNTADLPAAFPVMPGAGRVEPVSTCIDDAKTRSIDYMIAIEAIGQGTQATRYSRIASLLDALETAVDALDTGMVFVEYQTNVGIVEIAGGAFLTITMTITGRNQ